MGVFSIIPRSIHIWLFCLVTIPLYSQSLTFENLSLDKGLEGYYFNSIVEDKYGFIWVSTKNYGIYRWHNQNLKHYVNIADSVNHGPIHRLFTDEDDEIWIAADHGVYHFNIEEDQIYADQFINDDVLYPCKSVWTIYFRNDQIYIGTKCGIFIIDKKDNDFEHIDIDEFFRGHGHKERQVLSLLHSTEDESLLWVGTKYGLKQINLQNNEINTYPNPQKWHNQNGKNQQYAIYDMIHTEDGGLWMAGCWSGGILHFDNAQKSWDQYLYPNSRKEDPYRGNSIHSLSILSDSTFFYSNNRGGGYFDLFELNMRPVQLPDYEYHTNHDSDHLIDRNGHIWIVGIEGVFKSRESIHPTGMTKKVIPFVSTVDIDGKVKEMPFHEIRTPIDSNDILLKIEAGNQIDGEFSSVEYLLSPGDNKWVRTTASTTIALRNLSKGFHQLEYRLITSENNPTENGKSLTIIVHQPYYREVWFFALLSLVVILFLYFIYQYRIRRVRLEEQRKAQFERKIAEVELSALRAQMNPHFLFNTMNSINHFILKNDSDKASYYLSKFSRLVRQVLHNSKSSTVTLENELQALKLYVQLEQLRFDNQFEFHVVVDRTICPGEIEVPPMLLQPYVENAIWHGLMPLSDRKGILEINISRNGEILSIVIKDNGIGRHASLAQKSEYGEKKSYGMEITQDRIETINLLYGRKASISIEDLQQDGISMGTQIHIQIPIISR